MKFLYEEIARHWKTLTSEEEKQILSQYAQDGYNLALGYFSK